MPPAYSVVRPCTSHRPHVGQQIRPPPPRQGTPPPAWGPASPSPAAPRPWRSRPDARPPVRRGRAAEAGLRPTRTPIRFYLLVRPAAWTPRRTARPAVLLSTPPTRSPPHPFTTAKRNPSYDLPPTVW